MRLRTMTIVVLWAVAAAIGCGSAGSGAGEGLDGATAPDGAVDGPGGAIDAPEGAVDGPEGAAGEREGAVGGPDAAVDARAGDSGREDARDSAATPDAPRADGSLADAGGDDGGPIRDGGPDSNDAAPGDSGIRDGGGGSTDGGACASLQTGALPDGGDVTYAWSGVAKPACASRPFCAVGCEDGFLRDVLACNAVQGGYFWAQGSAYIRVFGRQGGSCVFDIGLETEGAVTFQRCTAPLPVSPWPGLYAVDSPGSSAAPNLLDGLTGCEVIARCNTMPGAPDPCDPGPTGPPTCPVNSAGAC